MKFKKSPARVALAPACVALMAVGVAGCGSSSDSGGSSASSGGGKGTLKIFMDYPADNQIADFADMKPAAEAAVEAVNKAGGVKGQKLQLIVCNNKYDQGQALVCARNAIKEKAVALVGQSDGFTPQTIPLLESAGIPSIGNFATGLPEDYTSKYVYPLNGGSVQGYLGGPGVLKQLGLTSFASQPCEYPSCKQLTQFINKATQGTGVTSKGAVTVPNTGVTDYSPYAQKTKALAPAAVVQMLSPTPQSGLIKAGQSIGFKPTYMGNDQMVGEKSVASQGATWQNYVLSGPFPSPRDQSNPAMKQYADERGAATNQTGQQWVDGAQLSESWANSLNVWLAVHAFAKAAANVSGTIDAKSLQSYLSTETNPIDLFGLVDWKPGAAGPSEFPRFNSMKNYAVSIIDNKIVTNTKVTPFDINAQ
ncbi:MAG: ABC transporter substrate-binding protein [Solirubrobacteraceae bacterium]|nr:ABC transporter substrate-binding protein [Patulibacter sp.]